ncbi:MAG: C1 family peptidase [Bacteroidales bacterium]
MKAFTPPRGILAILLLAVSCLLSFPMKAQTIQIDSLFTSDGEIFPFEPNDTIFGLSISGTVTLLSDTSLVRVILTDNSGNEWMVYEAYPMIVEDTSINFVEECDETCYMEGLLPSSISVQIYNAEISISYLLCSTTRLENLSFLQNQAKTTKDLLKVQQMNNYITFKGWDWIAGMNELVNMYYHDKANIFNKRYNLLGRDFYSGGSYYSVMHDNIPQYNDRSIISSFDWREKHNANLNGSPYFMEDGEHSGNGWLTGLSCQGSCGACSAFACIASLEAAINLYANYQFDVYESARFSERDAFNCSPFWNGEVGCNCQDGKIISTILQKFQNEGVVNEECYPKPEDMSDFCEGTGETCESFSSKCLNPDWTAQICGWKYYNFNGLETPTERANFLKELILENGPLTIDILFYPGPLSKAHAVSLVGFKFNEATGKIDWVCKNSWGPGWGNNGYIYEPFHLGDGALENKPQIVDMYAFKYDPLTCPDPLTITSKNEPSFELIPQENDFDKDGYYNWGIGKKPSNYLCSQEEDSNDDYNRIGPSDDNYFGIPVHPEMQVTYGIINGIPVKNGDIINISGNSSVDNLYTFQVSNNGNAQLNFQKVSIPIPPHAYIDIDFQNHPGWFEYYEGDYLDAAICMFSDETFQIKLNRLAEPGDLAHIRIYVNEPDIDDFEFTMIYYGCETTPGSYPIENLVRWDDPYMTQLQDIDIKSNGELIVTGTVFLSSQADIVVERGGKLIIDGGKFTASCDNLWNGIQVWGYSDKSQFDPEFPPGKVELSSNAVIENARIGIATVKSVNGVVDENYAGGKLLCREATFLNNIYGIRFYNYRNFDPYNPPYNELDYASYISNSTFITNGLLAEDGASPVAFIRMDDVVGIRLSGNQFMNTSGEEYDWNSRGNGIESYNAAYFMNGLCLDGNPPCALFKKNYFFNLCYGIKAHGQGRENRSVTVLSSDFHLNQKGMFVSCINNASINSNNFTVPEKSTGNEIPRYGLYLEICSGYTIEENSFEGWGDGLDENIGMYINTSGSEPNEVYKNDFSDLAYGIVAYGQNRSESGEGLCLLCNNFDFCTNDIQVIPEKDPYGRWLQGRNQGIATSQHNANSLTAPAGNTFTKVEDIPQAFNYFNHVDCNAITYYYHETNITNYKIIPDPVSIYLINSIPVYWVVRTIALYTIFESKDDACPSNFGGGGINLSVEKNVVSSENEMVTTYADSIQTVLDGGDTYTLNLDVMTSFPDEAYEIREQLLDESPYLSDTVMKSAIYKENVLPNAMIRDVLVANPQSAKSSEIIDKVNERNDPMSEEMMYDILEGRNFKGNLEILEDKLASHKTTKYESLHKLESYYKIDTIDFQGSQDSLIALWSQENDPEILYKLAFLYIYNHDSASCFNILNSIPQLSNLSDEQMLEYDDYISFMGILWSLKQDASSLDSLKIGQLTELLSRNTKIAYLARNVLVTYGLMDYTEPIYLADELKTMSVTPNKPRDSKNIKSNLIVFPNPAKNYIIVSYDLKERQGKSSIGISSIDGKSCYERYINGVKNQTTISLSGFSEGVYCIQLKNNGEVIESVKFVVSK